MRYLNTILIEVYVPLNKDLFKFYSLQQPGKLDMNNYTMVSDALQHITIGPPAHSRDRKVSTHVPYTIYFIGAFELTYNLVLFLCENPPVTNNWWLCRIQTD